MKKMRVVFWTESFLPLIGGVEIFSKQLLAALQKRGVEFTVITSANLQAGAGEEIVDGIHIVRLPFHRVIAQRDLKLVQELTKQVTALVHHIKPDLVHINSSEPSNFIFSLVHAVNSIPTIFTVHEPPVQAQDANSLVGRTMRAADWVVAVSQATLTQARQLVPEITPRSSVIYNGLEMPRLPVTALRSDLPSLLCIGRLVEEKGFDLAIRALGDIMDVFPTARLVIAGDGRARHDLELQVEALGLGRAVEFSGWCQPEKIRALIDAATIVLIPSRWQEPFGLVALEAAQRARPVIAARTGGLPEVVVHGETGVLFKKDDPNDLARQVIHLLHHPETARQLGNAARERAQHMFSLERATDEYDTLYRTIGQRNHSISEDGGQE